VGVDNSIKLKGAKPKPAPKMFQPPRNDEPSIYRGLLQGAYRKQLQAILVGFPGELGVGDIADLGGEFGKVMQV